MKLTKETLAKQLNGRQIGAEISSEESKAAAEAGLVVVYGASDDLVEFAGAIDDERGGPGDLLLTKQGLLEEHEDDYCECKFCGYKDAKKQAHTIEAFWCKDKTYSWTYRANTIPHASFDILEGTEKYCRGIVFALKSL